MLRSERRYCTEQQSLMPNLQNYCYLLAEVVAVVWKMDQTLKSPYK